MSREIERKFLLAGDTWRSGVVKQTKIVQGYLSATGTTVRVRVAGEAAFLTLKGQVKGISRDEYEYRIPLRDARELLGWSVAAPVSKIRYLVPAGSGLRWEIDEYLGLNAPLFTAELELPEPEAEFLRPEWLGAEITGDYRYSNRSLSLHPYSTWKKDDLQ